MSTWPHHQRSHFARGHRMRQRDLTQLYNDTKVNFETAFGPRNTTTNVFDQNDPDVLALRRDFQEQQDRLLAWGIHWADKQANTSSKGKEAGYDVSIDEKVDQAGLGDVVASIMENIKTTLSQSGKLQHPDRWRENRSPQSGAGGAWGAFKSGMMKEKMGLTIAADRTQDWKHYELTTGRELYNKLKECIDLLYALDTQREDDDMSSKAFESKDMKSQQSYFIPNPSGQRVSVDQALSAKEHTQAAHQLLSHPLYIDFSRLEPMHDPNAAAEPPSYEEAKQNTQPIQAKSVYYFAAMQTHVLVDLARAQSYPIIPEAMTESDPIQQAHQLAQVVSGNGLLTWDGHLKLLGFTIAHGNSRFGLVYALPAPQDPTALQACQTLTTSINATRENESSIPPLENKFRLAYNIALNATSFLAHGHCHGHIKSSNIVFLRENDNPRLGKALRCPFILQPVQELVGEPRAGQPLRESIYHHTGTDEVGYGVVAAYDLFSVGMILLEIGLWRSLVSFWKPKYDMSAFHERLLRLYVPKLASKCGTRYMNLVRRCLEAPDHLQDKPSTIDAAEYLLDIVEDLGRCCTLDEAGQPSELDIEVYESLIHAQKMENPPQSKLMPSTPILRRESTQTRPAPVKKPSTSSKIKQKSADSLRKWPDLDIPQDHLETWNTMLMPRLSKMLRSALKDSMESCSVSLMMIGSSPEKAKTTICVQCRDTARVRETLCSRFKPKSGWGLVVCAGDVRRSGQISRKSTKSSTHARRSGAGGSMLSNNDDKTREQLYQPWPGNGASIGAWTNEQHLPPVSFGGTVIIDGQPFGMTVHHMLDDPEDVERLVDEARAEIPARSSAQRPVMPNFDQDSIISPQQDDLIMSDNLDDLELFDNDDRVETSDDDDMSDGESDTSTIRPEFAIVGEENEDWCFYEEEDDDIPDLDDGYSGHSSDESDDELETSSVGDRVGILADRFDDEEFCITQPAFDDVPENFFSDDPEYRDEEHLLSHSFGYIHASSGLKRVMRLNMKHEVDWALIKINDRRLNLAVNPEAAGLTSRQASRSSKIKRKDSVPQSAVFIEPALTAITPMTSMPKMLVSCIGRTSGKTTGRVSQALSLLKLPGRQSFSASFTVEGGMGVPGDSGAWVYNEEKKELCGHILAFSEALNLAYIVPMEILFEDLKIRLGAKEVRLPAQPSMLNEMPPQVKASVYGMQDMAAIHENKENMTFFGDSLSDKLQQQLSLNTGTIMPRESSDTGGMSPVSVGSATLRRSRVARVQSPTHVQLPTPPGMNDTERNPSKDVYGYGSSPSTDDAVGKKCTPVTRPIQS